MTKRSVIGVLLLGSLAAAAFAYVWGSFATISLPAFLEPLRVTYPRIIVWWAAVLYMATVLVMLSPAAVFWAAIGGGGRIVGALLAAAPLVLLRLAEVVYVASSVRPWPPLTYPALDISVMLVGAIGLFVGCDVVRRLTMRWSGP